MRAARRTGNVVQSSSPPSYRSWPAPVVVGGAAEAIATAIIASATSISWTPTRVTRCRRRRQAGHRWHRPYDRPTRPVWPLRGRPRHAAAAVFSANGRDEITRALVSISGGSSFDGQTMNRKKEECAADQFTIFESNAMKRDTVSANHVERMFHPLASG